MTVVHHQSRSPIPPQNGTDQTELMECISALRSEVRQLKEDTRRRSLMQSSPQAVHFPNGLVGLAFVVLKWVQKICVGFAGVCAVLYVLS